MDLNAGIKALNLTTSSKASTFKNAIKRACPSAYVYTWCLSNV